MQAAVIAQGQRSLRGADLAQRGVAVQVFLAVPFERRDPPGARGAAERELGQLGADARLAHRRLPRELVAEADAVVVDAEHHVETAPGMGRVHRLLGEAGTQFVVVVAGQAALAPRLLPGLVETAARLPDQFEVAFQAPVAEQEAQPRRGDHRLAPAFHPVGDASFVLRFKDDGEHVAGRGDACQVRRPGDGQAGQQQEQGEGDAVRERAGAWQDHDGYRLRSTGAAGRCHHYSSWCTASSAAAALNTYAPAVRIARVASTMARPPWRRTSHP